MVTESHSHRSPAEFTNGAPFAAVAARYALLTPARALPLATTTPALTTVATTPRTTAGVRHEPAVTVVTVRVGWTYPEKGTALNLCNGQTSENPQAGDGGNRYTKTVDVPYRNLVCPPVVNVTNWHGCTYTIGEEFDIIVEDSPGGSLVTATRTDRRAMWTIDLTFSCTGDLHEPADDATTPPTTAGECWPALVVWHTAHRICVLAAAATPPAALGLSLFWFHGRSSTTRACERRAL